MHPRQLLVINHEFKSQLLEELKWLQLTPLHATPSMLWLQEDRVEPAWAQCVWRNVIALPYDSISDARKKLAQISPRWSYYGDLLHRRGSLIAAGLNLNLELDHRKFPIGAAHPVAAFTLAGADMIFYSLSVQRPTASGGLTFVENKIEPPSRAYLKLWEALTILGDYPRPDEHVVDLGACPGSWSWVLGKLGAQVISIDRSELKLKILFPRLQFQRGDAFAFQPRKMDWVLSDVICAPDKLLSYVKTWIHSGLCTKYICTVKFTGQPDYRVIDEFRKLPRSRIIHLAHNKNEVTWISHPALSLSSNFLPEK